jgi:hypothetical protein
VDYRAPLLVIAAFCTYCGAIATSDPAGTGGSGGLDGSAQCDDTTLCSNDSVCVVTCGSAWCKRIPPGCVIGSDACSLQLCDGVIGTWLNDRVTACMIPCIVGLTDAGVGDAGIH